MSDDLPTRPSLDPDTSGNGLSRAGRSLGIEYPWRATDKPARARSTRIRDAEDEPEVFDDELRDLTEIFGVP